MADNNLSPQDQIALKERLQTLWLQHMEKLLTEGTITSTDLATLARVLLQNGWTLDPTKLPSDLRSKLTSQIDPNELDDNDVLPMRRQA